MGIDDEDDSTFTVTVDNKTFHFQVVTDGASDPDKQCCGFMFIESESGSVLFCDFGSVLIAIYFLGLYTKPLTFPREHLDFKICHCESRKELAHNGKTTTEFYSLK